MKERQKRKSASGSFVEGDSPQQNASNPGRHAFMEATGASVEEGDDLRNSTRVEFQTLPKTENVVRPLINLGDDHR